MNIRMRGFTLIELMIVVAIIAILAAIAYPSYREHVRRSDRADARAALLENAQFLERTFTVSNRYDQDSAGNAIDDAALPVTQSPRAGTAKYAITVASDASTFTLTATPTGAMVGDSCGTFTLTNTGARGAASDSCWSR